MKLGKSLPSKYRISARDEPIAKNPIYRSDKFRSNFSSDRPITDIYEKKFPTLEIRVKRQQSQNMVFMSCVSNSEGRFFMPQLCHTKDVKNGTSFIWHLPKAR